MSDRHTPDGFHSITPNAIVADARKAIDFYKRVFDAVEKVCLRMPDGKIVHCELQIGDSRLNLAESMDGWPVHPLLAQIHVPDSDATFERAIAAGATEIMPMTDMFFGAREGRVLDPSGNSWTISTRTEDVSPEEMQRRIDEMATTARGPEPVA